MNFALALDRGRPCRGRRPSPAPLAGSRPDDAHRDADRPRRARAATISPTTDACRPSRRAPSSAAGAARCCSARRSSRRQVGDMISRRVFLKNGGLALVSLGFAPAFLARTAARGSRRARAAHRDLPARRGGRPEHGRALRRARLLPRAADASRSPRPGGGADAALDLDGFFGLHPRLAPLEPLYTAASSRSSTPAARPTRRARTSTRRTTWRRRRPA